MSKQLDKLRKDSPFIKACEIDLGRHTVIEILTEAESEISATCQTKLDELLAEVAVENERLLKYIMKACFCSKSGAEHLLDEVVDKLSNEHDEVYFINAAGLTDFLEQEGIELA